MIKQAVFLLVLFLSVHVCPAQDYDKLPGQKDRQSFGLKGLVRQLSEKQWRPAGDSLVVIGAKGIGPDSSYILERSDEAVFDSLGNMQSLVSNDPDERKRRALKQTVHYYYYQKERMSAIRIKEEGSPADSLAFTWRKNGQADHYSLYNGKNELQYKMTYAYKNGKLFTARKNDAGNFPVLLIRYKYDKGRLVEAQYFDDQFRLSGTRRYNVKRTADKLLNESYALSDAQGKMKEGMTWVKDSLGHVLEQNAINASREVTEYKRFAYDDKGFPIEERTISAVQELTITNRYTYDASGNWIRKEIYYGDRLRSVVIRELKYF